MYIKLEINSLKIQLYGCMPIISPTVKSASMSMGGGPGGDAGSGSLGMPTDTSKTELSFSLA